MREGKGKKGLIKKYNMKWMTRKKNYHLYTSIIGGSLFVIQLFFLCLFHILLKKKKIYKHVNDNLRLILFLCPALLNHNITLKNKKAKLAFPFFF